MVNGPHILFLQNNAYGYFCACSALSSCGGDTWGVAPGSKLLRLWRALLEKAFPIRSRQLRISSCRPREIKRPTFTFLKTAPSSLKRAPGNVKVGLYKTGDNSSCYGVALHPCAFYLFLDFVGYTTHLGQRRMSIRLTSPFPRCPRHSWCAVHPPWGGLGADSLADFGSVLCPTHKKNSYRGAGRSRHLVYNPI